MIDTMKLAELLMVMLAINEGEKKVSEKNEEIAFNDLTDNLFGYLAQIGLRRTSQELEGDVFGDVDYRAAYDALIKLARSGSEECILIRDGILAGDE